MEVKQQNNATPKLMEMRKTNVVVILLAVMVAAGCDSIFDVHPYDAHFDGETDINNRNIRRIEDECRDKLPMHVAFISDSHIDYADLRAMVDDINRRDSIDFVVHLGDLYDKGICMDPRETGRTEQTLCGTDWQPRLSWHRRRGV